MIWTGILAATVPKTAPYVTNTTASCSGQHHLQTRYKAWISPGALARALAQRNRCSSATCLILTHQACRCRQVRLHSPCCRILL